MVKAPFTKLDSPGGIDEGSFKGETLSPDPELVQSLDSVVSRKKETNPGFFTFTYSLKSFFSHKCFGYLATV
jgi:hypothetical protein